MGAELSNFQRAVTQKLFTHIPKKASNESE